MVRIKATTMSAMPLHCMRVADMTVLVRELTAWDGVWRVPKAGSVTWE